MGLEKNHARTPLPVREQKTTHRHTVAHSFRRGAINGRATFPNVFDATTWAPEILDFMIS